MNKVEQAGITPVEGPSGTVYFSEARLVIICKKIYTQDLVRENILNPAILKEMFLHPEFPMHRMYVGEVVTCLDR